MKFFRWYVIGFISVWLLSSFLVYNRDKEMNEDFAVLEVPIDKTLNSAFSRAKTAMSNNSFVEYHVSEDILRKSSQHTLKGMQLIDENGVQVVMDFEPTQVFPVYYIPGSFLYGASAYVPTYEDTVKLSLVKSKLKRKRDPLKWSWSPRKDNLSSKNNKKNLTTIDRPVDMKLITKEGIPSSGIIPTGYFVLPKPKSKPYNKTQMGIIPQGYYIYDDNNMAKIPPGFIASEDRKRISRKSEATTRKSATDFTTY